MQHDPLAFARRVRARYYARALMQSSRPPLGMRSRGGDDKTFPTVPEALAKLEALGSADQMALHLQEQGIQAIPGCMVSCLVADYLQQETDCYVRVGSRTAWTLVRPTDRPDFPDNQGVNLPAEVRKLISNFDQGKYPELIHPALREDPASWRS